MSYKRLFSASLEAAPGRLHFAAHSHHLWPDASRAGHLEAWEDAARLADRKWDRALGEVWREAQDAVAAELRLPDPASIAFGANTHELLTRLVSAREERPLRVLASSGEFHAFRRQAQRWAESGRIRLETVPLEPFDSFRERFCAAAESGGFDLLMLSHIFFQTGWVLEGLERLAGFAAPGGPWLVLDGYHAFMAIEADLSAIADRAFYLGGGYKYAMTGEGLGFLHAPAGFALRPELTGWFAEFAALSAPPGGGVAYATDARRFLGATFEPTALYRFTAVRRMLAREGLDTRAVNAHLAPLRVMLEADIAAGRAGRLGEAVLLNPYREGRANARFLALRHPEAQAWREALGARDVITDARAEVLRIGLGLYHDPEDVAKFCATARTL